MIFKILGWLITVVLLLVLLAFAFLQTEWGKGLVRDIVVDALNDALKGRIEVDRIGGFLPFDARIEGFRVHDPDGRLVLSVASVTADFHPLDLFDRRIRLSNVLVETPELVLFDDRDRLGLLEAFAPRDPGPDSEGPAWELAFEGIRLDGGTLERLLPGPEDLTLAELGLDLVLKLGASGLEWPRLTLRGRIAGPDELARLISGPVAIETRGGLRDGAVAIDLLEVRAAGHTLSATGRLGLGDPLTAKLELSSFTLDPTRLPEPLASNLRPPTSASRPAPDTTADRVTGFGSLSLEADHTVRLELISDTPLGLAIVTLGADLDLSAPTAAQLLGVWALDLHLVDLAPPSTLSARLPASARSDRLDITLHTAGHGLPPGRPGDDGHLHLDLALRHTSAERGPASRTAASPPPAPALELSVFRRPGAAPELVYLATLDLIDLPLQPWLELVGEPALTGALTQLHADATLSLPDHAPPELRAVAAFDLSAAGFLSALTPPVPLDAGHLRGTANAHWDGKGLPLARLDLAGDALAFDLGNARSLSLGLDLVPRGDELALIGTVSATDATWDDIRVGRLELPLALALGPTLSRGALPSGTIRWFATDLAVGPRTLASTRGDLIVTTEARRLRVRGGLGAANLVLDRQTTLGSADLELDLVFAPDPARAASEASPIPIGGPITGRLSGRLDRIRQGPRSVDRLDLSDLALDIPLSSRGLEGRVTAVGGVEATGVRLPEATITNASATIDAQLDTRTMQASGTANIEARDLVVQTGQTARNPDGSTRPVEQRFARAKLDAAARPDGAIALTGSVFQPESTGETPSFDAHFRGELRLPSRTRKLSARIDKLELERQGSREKALVLEGVTFEDGGWISLLSLEARSGRSAGVITGSGRFRPSDGALDLTLDTTRLDLFRWLIFARDGLRWLDLDPTPMSELAKLLNGQLVLSLVARGSLASPELELRLRAASLRYKDQTGGSADLALDLVDGGLVGDINLRWHRDGRLSASTRAPVRVSLSPLTLTWDHDAPLELDLRVEEPDLERARALASTLVPSLKPPGVAGALDFFLRVSGTPSDPRLQTALLVDQLDLSPTWKNGQLTLEGSAQEDRSGFRFELSDARNRVQTQVDITLPFAIPRAFRESDPFAWMRARLDTRPFRIDLKVPPFVVAETPLASLLPPDLADLAADIDLRFGGTFIEPVINGHATLRSPDASLYALGFALNVDTLPDGLVHSRIGLQGRDGETLLDGSLTLPGLSTVLRDPGRIDELARDPRLNFELFSAEIRSIDFWELREGLGDLFAQLFPDGWLMLNANARGTPSGLSAGVYLRVRTTAPRGYVAPAINDPTASRRNAADDLRLAVTVADKTSVSLVMTQDTRSLTPSLGIHAVLGISSDALLSGRLGKVDDIPIEVGRLRAGELRLEGFAAVFRSLLGASGGELTGDITVSGTLGAPRFANGLRAQFAPFVIVPLGIAHDTATLTLDFPSPTQWRLTSSELYAEGLTARTTENHCGITPWVDRVNDFSKTPYLSVLLEGSIPRLVPREMGLSGCIGLKDYPVLATSEMTGRVDGKLELSGTAARPAVRGDLTVVSATLAPELRSKSSRAIGPPLDVTIVRGDPEPPPVRRERNPFQTGVAVDVAITLPKDAVRVEPSLLLPLGEVRALLYPHGQLRIRTAAGELSLVGTIEVPKEYVLLYGKTFNVDPESRLVFTGDMANDPQLFFTARHNIAHVDLGSIGLSTTKDSEVVVRVTGTPTAPRLDFSSSPPMDETNILSVIALGVPAGGGEALGDAVQSQLLTAVMGMATLQFARDFQQRLALDVLRIEARSADPTDTRLTIGKRLSDDLFLNYYLNLAARQGEDQQSGSLEYRFTRFLSLLARGGDAGDVGLELNLRLQDSPPVSRSTGRRRERTEPRPRKGPELAPPSSAPAP